MNRASLLLAAALVTPVLWGQPDRSRYIPALAYGPGIWSIVRLTNSGTALGTVRVEVYREDGTRLPLEPMIDVAPGDTRDVRVDGSSATNEVCWAHVTLPDGVEARGFVEVLKGDALEDFSREAHVVSSRPRWVTLTSGVQGRYLFFLNAAEQPTIVSFCAADQPEADACKKKRNSAIRLPVGPRQLIGIQVRKPRRRFFITESSVPSAAVLALFDNGPGDKRFFGSKSTIEFGEIER